MFLSLALISVVTAACISLTVASDNLAQEPAAEPTFEVVLRSEVEWGLLIPPAATKARRPAPFGAIVLVPGRQVFPSDLWTTSRRHLSYPGRIEHHLDLSAWNRSLCQWAKGRLSLGQSAERPVERTLLKLLAGFIGKNLSHGPVFRAVVQGQAQYQVPNEGDFKTLEPGSYFSSKGKSLHHISSKAGGECIIYVSMDGRFDIIPAKSTK
ncbi:MAG TPA: DUF4437 domain-containing protein [Nitrospirales bacterium]|nr:DUF4437 domain-containing protein [Nitrospirales bacterium]